MSIHKFVFALQKSRQAILLWTFYYMMLMSVDTSWKVPGECRVALVMHYMIRLLVPIVTGRHYIKWIPYVILFPLMKSYPPGT